MDYRKLHWHSDWNGYEVGYDDVSVVGLYSIRDFPELSAYVDTENEVFLEVWLNEEEDE